MDKVAAKLMATLAKYQLRHGEFPNVWYVSPEEMHVLTGQEELEEIVMPSPVGYAVIEFKLRTLSKVFKVFGH